MHISDENEDVVYYTSYIHSGVSVVRIFGFMAFSLWPVHSNLRARVTRLMLLYAIFIIDVAFR